MTEDPGHRLALVSQKIRATSHLIQLSIVDIAASAILYQHFDTLAHTL